MGRRVQIPVSMVEFDEGGRTIWVHSEDGAGTVMRIKLSTGIHTKEECENNCSHIDITMTEPSVVPPVFCLSKDAHRA